MENRLGVIGIGRLGLSFALLCAQKGYTVYGYDIRQEYIDSLNNGTYKTSEPLINTFLGDTDRSVFTTNLKHVITQCDMLFCFVATPSDSYGAYDHSAIDRVVADLQELHVSGVSMDGKVLAIGCTTMPGYTDTVSERLDIAGISVAYNPEFIAQGDIINGLKTADMVLMGVPDDSTFYQLQAIYRTIMDFEPVISRMSPKAAEITKIAVNCYLTTKISFANMIGEIATESGIEQEIPTILRAIGSDSRVGHKYLGYGFGFSGVCLPRDNRALGVHAARVSANSIIPRTVDTFNEFHYQYLKEQYIQRNPDKNTPFLFTQLAYKKGTDILTESQYYKLCKDLLQQGYKVDIAESDNVIQQVQQELEAYKHLITYNTAQEGYRIEL